MRRTVAGGIVETSRTAGGNGARRAGDELTAFRPTYAEAHGPKQPRWPVNRGAWDGQLYGPTPYGVGWPARPAWLQSACKLSTTSVV